MLPRCPIEKNIKTPKITEQFYYIPYTDFKYNISVYLDDILQSEWNINVTSKLFEVQLIIQGHPCWFYYSVPSGM